MTPNETTHRTLTSEESALCDDLRLTARTCLQADLRRLRARVRPGTGRWDHA